MEIGAVGCSREETKQCGESEGMVRINRYVLLAVGRWFFGVFLSLDGACRWGQELGGRLQINELEITGYYCSMKERRCGTSEGRAGARMRRRYSQHVGRESGRGSCIWPVLARPRGKPPHPSAPECDRW